ncbi:MAG: cytochrome c [Candidatus Nitricoxidivorans perseverans]|uniref:Cytochrome c n=1 Tax=Candidatus Nitricoxidivorans perseverans TaxID=2975601 RepID=A0AA49J2J4_9PROT|nr:MAG: cytochrome c [Candidatus Nitricoxidivorans perseverans]
MEKIARIVIAGASMTLASGALMAQAKPEDLIKFRQSGYTFMAWNMGRIKASVEGAYNKDQVVQAANAIAAIANSGMGALYAPGTDKGKGWKDTRVKPELFTDREGVGKVARAFNMAANEMARAAASGDQLAVTEAFDNLGKACKGCHDKYRVDEK